MENVINNVKLNVILKSLVANGSTKDIKLKVGGNSLAIGEVSFIDSSSGGKINVNFDKEAGGNLEISGDRKYEIKIKDLSIRGNGGEEFSITYLELDSIVEAVELFGSLMK